MADNIPIFDEEAAYERECIDAIVISICDRGGQSNIGGQRDDDQIYKKQKQKSNAKSSTQTTYEWSGVGESDRCERLLSLLLSRGPGAVVLESDLKAMTKDKMGFTAVKRDLHTLVSQGRVSIVNPQRGSRGRGGWTVVQDP